MNNNAADRHATYSSLTPDGGTDAAIYTDPDHVIASADGEVRQEFNITFYARVTGGAIAVSAESTDVEFLMPVQSETLPVHETVRLRLRHHAEQRSERYLG